MLISIDVLNDENDPTVKHLVFQFTEGTLSIECPVGIDSLESVDVFESFIRVAKQAIVANPVTFH